MAFSFGYNYAAIDLFHRHDEREDSCQWPLDEISKSGNGFLSCPPEMFSYSLRSEYHGREVKCQDGIPNVRLQVGWLGGDKVILYSFCHKCRVLFRYPSGSSLVAARTESRSNCK